jgi:hypothetical protein
VIRSIDASGLRSGVEAAVKETLDAGGGVSGDYHVEIDFTLRDGRVEYKYRASLIEDEG